MLEGAKTRSRSQSATPAQPSASEELRNFMLSRLNDPEDPSARGTGISELVNFADTLVTKPDSSNLPGFSFHEDATEAAEIQKNKRALTCAKIVLAILEKNASSQKYSLREIAGDSATLTYNPAAFFWCGTSLNFSGNTEPGNTEPITINIKQCESSDVIMLTFSTANQPDTKILFYDSREAKQLPLSESRPSASGNTVDIRDPIDRFPLSLAKIIRADHANIFASDEEDDDVYFYEFANVSRIKNKASTAAKNRKGRQAEADFQRDDPIARRHVAENLLHAAMVEANCPAIPRAGGSNPEEIAAQLIGQKALLVYQLLTKKIVVDTQDPSTTAAALCLTMHGLFFDRNLYNTFLSQLWCGVWKKDLAIAQKRANRTTLAPLRTGRLLSDEHEEDGQFKVFFELLKGRWGDLVKSKLAAQTGPDSTARRRDEFSIWLEIYTDKIINSFPENQRNALIPEVEIVRRSIAEISASQTLKALVPVLKAVNDLGMRLFNEAKQAHNESLIAAEDRITLREFLLAIKAAGDLSDQSFFGILSSAGCQRASTVHRISDYFNKGLTLDSEEADALIGYLKLHASTIPSAFLDNLSNRL